ncbi:hypothetical protein AAG596_00020 [Citromicrobium bathyomarinum]|uniref:hypothetical protein n=1 Tax=Citromicrobium bathyomarinum TaxID=72174 RepID=UPI003159EC72
MTDFKELVESHASLRDAEAGDMSLLLDRLEQGLLSERERHWLAAELRGEHKPTAGRPKGRQSTNFRRNVKGRFEDNNCIDLAALDAFNWLVSPPAWASEKPKSRNMAYQIVAEVLEEGERNVRKRISRVTAYLDNGHSRASYVSGADRAHWQETMRSLAQIMPSPWPLERPRLLDFLRQ